MKLTAEFHLRHARAYEQCANDPTVPKKWREKAAKDAKLAREYARKAQEVGR